MSYYSGNGYWKNGSVSALETHLLPNGEKWDLAKFQDFLERRLPWGDPSYWDHYYPSGPQHRWNFDGGARCGCGAIREWVSLELCHPVTGLKGVKGRSIVQCSTCDRWYQLRPEHLT